MRSYLRNNCSNFADKPADEPCQIYARIDTESPGHRHVGRPRARAYAARRTDRQLGQMLPGAGIRVPRDVKPQLFIALSLQVEQRAPATCRWLWVRCCPRRGMPGGRPWVFVHGDYSCERTRYTHPRGLLKLHSGTRGCLSPPYPLQGLPAHPLCPWDQHELGWCGADLRLPAPASH